MNGGAGVSARGGWRERAAVFLQSAHLPGFGSVFGFKLASTVAAFAAMALAGRVLGRAGLGDLTMLRTIMLLLAGLVGPALDMALVRFSAHEMAHGQGGGERYFTLIFWIKAALSAAFLVAGIALAKPIFTRFFDAADSTVQPWAVVWAFVGAIGILFLEYERAYFQAKQRFASFGLLDFLHAALRLAAIGALALAELASASFLFGTYALTPVLLAAAAWFWMPKGLLVPIGEARPAAPELFRYTGWVLAACICTSCVNGLDMMLIGWFGVDELARGDYSAARSLMQVGDLAILALFNVLLPSASKIRTTGEAHAFLRKQTPVAILLALLMIPGLLLAGPAVQITFGKDFSSGGPLFAVLLLGIIFNLASAPAGTALYGLGRSRTVALLEGLKLLLTLIIGWWAAPRYGVLGMAWTVAGIKGTIGVLTYGAARWAAQRGGGHRGEAEPHSAGDKEHREP